MPGYTVTLHVQRLVDRKRSTVHTEVKTHELVAGSLALAARKTITALEGYRPGGKGEKLTIEVERLR